MPKPAANRTSAQPLRDRVLRLAPGVVDGLVDQAGGLLDRSGLGEVDDVDRPLPGRHQLLERLLQRRQRPGEGQRHRPYGVVDDRRLPPVAPAQVGGQLGHVAERRRHQQVLSLGQLDQRHLPRPAAARLAVEVELVHDDQSDVGTLTLAQSDVAEHLGGAADDRGVRVDRDVTGQHPDVLGAEDLAQVEELLADQRLDRRRVERDPVVGERGHVRRDRDQRLPRAGRRRQDDVVARQELEDRLLLVRVEVQIPFARIREEAVVRLLCAISHFLPAGARSRRPRAGCRRSPACRPGWS